MVIGIVNCADALAEVRRLLYNVGLVWSSPIDVILRFARLRWAHPDPPARTNVAAQRRHADAGCSAW